MDYQVLAAQQLVNSYIDRGSAAGGQRLPAGRGRGDRLGCGLRVDPGVAVRAGHLGAGRRLRAWHDGGADQQVPGDRRNPWHHRNPAGGAGWLLLQGLRGWPGKSEHAQRDVGVRRPVQQHDRVCDLVVEVGHRGGVGVSGQRVGAEGVPVPVEHRSVRHGRGRHGGVDVCLPVVEFPLHHALQLHRLAV